MTVDKINVYDTVKNEIESANAKNNKGDNLNLQSSSIFATSLFCEDNLLLFSSLMRFYSQLYFI